MKQLLLTGDDFGRSSAVNEAIEKLHEGGVLTQASLMVNEPAAEEAVRIAQRHPQLCVGLHLTLCDGRASEVSAITDDAGNFVKSPARAGLRYAFDPRAAEPLAREIAAQLARFRALGFAPSYLDGHTHLHLHPVIFRLLLHPLSAAGFKLLRLVREPDCHHPVALIFRALSAAAAGPLDRLGIAAADRVYGLADTGRMTGERLARLIARLPEGLSEIYFHPGAEPEPFDPEPLRQLIADRNIILTAAAKLPPPRSAA